MSELRVLQFFLIILVFMCTVLTIYNYLTKGNFLFPLAIMILCLISCIILSLHIYLVNKKYNDLVNNN